MSPVLTAPQALAAHDRYQTLTNSSKWLSIGRKWPQIGFKWLKIAPKCSRVPNLVTKGPKGPICCQIWNGFGSIGSVFGSSVPPNASCVRQNGLKSTQRESKWLKTGPKWVKMAQNAQNGPKMGVTEHFGASAKGTCLLGRSTGGPKAAKVWHPLRPCGVFGRSFRYAVFWQCLFCLVSPILGLF